MEAAEVITTTNHDFAPVIECAEEAIRDGATPGMVVLVARDGRVLFHKAFGAMTYKSAKNSDPLPMKVDTVFDIASLTASVITTTLMMKLYEELKFELNDRVCRFEQGFGVLGKSPITILHLLSHTSGLPGWVPFFENLLEEHSGARRGIITSRGAREFVFNQINRLELKNPIGSKQVYSDVGNILLGHLVELLTGVGLEKAAHRYIFTPMIMKSTSFIDLSMIKRRGIHPVTDLIAPTEDCPWRKRVLCGEVHDDNAWVMGGIAGHAGLFSTAYDLHVFASTLLASYHGASQFIKRETLKKFWRPLADASDGWRLGWDAPSRDNGMMESGLSQQAVGHNGLTGCGLWIEPEQGLVSIVLSNRVHPTRNNKKFLALRPELQKRIIQVVGK